MKSAKPLQADVSSHRRSQPVRQTRTNPPRSSATTARTSARDSAGPAGDQPIDIFPAVTHFADAMTSLPKDLVRHFTLLKEVDAKLFTPEEQLSQLVSAAMNAPLPEPRPNNDTTSDVASASAPNTTASRAPSVDESIIAASSVFEPANLPRRQLFRQTAFKIQEMLVSLEEKNHVISTANDALQRQLARIEDVWPHLENEFSDEAKWGSMTHWAYPENRSGKHPERARRDGAAVISAAAQALAEEAAARSDARKQALQAKKSLKNNHHDSDFDNHDIPRTGKGHGKGRRVADANHVGLGIMEGNPPPKKRKVEKLANGGVAMERSISSALSHAAKSKAASPTPGPDGITKKRKALPSGSGQSKKKAAMSPSIKSSPIIPPLPEPKGQIGAPPAPSNAPRPNISRARQNSLQSSARPPPIVAVKPNGTLPGTPEVGSSNNTPRPGNDVRPAKESSVPAKGEGSNKEADKVESAAVTGQANGKKETRAEDKERKSESLPPIPVPVTVTTKSGRASKPSTPALATFQEASRARSSRNLETAGNKKNAKKAAAPVPPLALPIVDDEATSGEGDIDADEPTYCYCNSVSYGQMVACDSDECTREWFHLACVGLKVAPAENSAWYCEDCKERRKHGGKKVNGR